jgi:hypothetical protein
VLAVTLPEWADTTMVRNAILIALAVLLVLVVVVIRAVQKLVLKFVLLAALIAIGISLWAQREQLNDCAQTCDCHLYGQDVVLANTSLRHACDLRDQQT